MNEVIEHILIIIIIMDFNLLGKWTEIYNELQCQQPPSLSQAYNWYGLPSPGQSGVQHFKLTEAKIMGLIFMSSIERHQQKLPFSH